jgi:hypothetical protein
MVLSCNQPTHVLPCPCPGLEQAATSPQSTIEIEVRAASVLTSTILQNPVSQQVLGVTLTVNCYSMRTGRRTGCEAPTALSRPAGQARRPAGACARPRARRPQPDPARCTSLPPWEIQPRQALMFRCRNLFLLSALPISALPRSAFQLFSVSAFRRSVVRGLVVLLGNRGSMLRQERGVRGHRVLRQIQRLALISPKALRHRAVGQFLLQPR